MREFVCQSCGKTFVSRKACKSRTPMYCSRECYAESLRKYKTCEYCGKVFADYTKDKYCSIRCRTEASRGVSLSLEHRHKLSEARKASPKCHGENLYNWKGGKATYLVRMRAHNLKRRTSLHTPLDPLYMLALRFTQRNKCFYCGCDMGNTPSLEHLVPVSKGGDNEWWNLVCACKSCNSRKHDKTLAEFAIRTGDFSMIDRGDIVTMTAKMLYDRKRKNNTD